MARLVDADSLQKLFNEISSALLSNPVLSKDVEHMVRAFLMVSEMISDAPTADAEPVVRCKDCKHSEHWYGDKRRCFLWCETGIDVFEDGYCSYGERREDEAD